MSKDNKEIYKDISDFLRWHMYKEALDLLERNPSLDTTYNNGEFFRRAMSADKPELVRHLIDNYHALHTEDHSEYQKALHKMQQIIEDAVASSDISEEMNTIVSRYVRGSEEDSQEDLLGDTEDSSGET